MSAQPRQPFSNSFDDPGFRFLGVPTLLRATSETTGGQVMLAEHPSMPPGFGSPYHTHRNEDEAFYVIDGEVAFVCDGRWIKAGPGTFVYGPRDVPHGFQVIGATNARMLVMGVPAGFERFVLELAEPPGAPPSPPDMARLAAAAARHGIEIHGPLPAMPAW